MAIERWWPAVSPQLFTADGGAYGLIQVADTRGFKVKALVIITATGQPDLQAQVKRVISDTQMLVGIIGKPLTSYIDISAYTTALGAFIYANEQEKAKVVQEDREYATYDQEPTVAWRNVLVDELGRYYGSANPLPVSATVIVPPLSVRRLTDKDNDGTPDDLADAIQVGDGTNRLAVNSDGSINTNQLNSITLQPFITNIPMALAGTEYSFAFPANTFKFLMKVRNGTSKAQFAYVSSQSGTNYITLHGGSFYAEESNMTGKTIYFQATKASQIMEMLYWTI